MPKRKSGEEKPPERPIRIESTYESMGLMANPKVDESEKYQDPITRNITLSNFNPMDREIIMDCQALYQLCISQGMFESAEFINAYMQQYSNACRGLGGLTAEMITTYNVKQKITKEYKGEKPKSILGKKEGE